MFTTYNTYLGLEIQFYTQYGIQLQENNSPQTAQVFLQCDFTLSFAQPVKSLSFRHDSMDNSSLQTVINMILLMYIY